MPPTQNDHEQERQAKLDAYRAQTRRTMQAFSDQALCFQDSIIIGGIDREECDREIMRRLAVKHYQEEVS
jgi:hypothetical protein